MVGEKLRKMGWKADLEVGWNDCRAAESIARRTFLRTDRRRLLQSRNSCDDVIFVVLSAETERVMLRCGVLCCVVLL